MSIPYLFSPESPEPGWQEGAALRLTEGFYEDFPAANYVMLHPTQ